MTRELAGDFVMHLYNNGFILGNRVAAKTFVQRKFKAFLRAENVRPAIQDSDATLDEILKKFEFVCKTIRDEKIYKFDYAALFRYRNEVIAHLDAKEIEKANTSILCSENLNSSSLIYDKPKVLEDFPQYELIFQFRARQQINKSFIFSSKGCYCCQINFKKEDDYASHIKYHSQESDFEFRNKYQSQNEVLSQQLSITYKLCEKSHLLFSIKSLFGGNIVIEKVVAFRPGSIHYLEDMIVPYLLPSDGSDFYVNSHIFQIANEQPVLVIYKLQDDPSDVRYVEEHHFLRFDVFPSTINLKTKHVFRRGELQIKLKLPEYSPSPFAKMMHLADFDEKVHTIRQTVRNFIKKTAPLNDGNICDVFDFLIEMEDYARSKSYESLYRQGVRIQGCAADYSTRIPWLDAERENVLSSGDRIILISNELKKGKGDKVAIFEARCQTENGLSGVVTRVVGERVYFESKSGKLATDVTYDVAFKPLRLNFIYQHRALELLRNDIHLRARLFPEDSIRNIPSAISLDYYNVNIADNPEQKEAVQNIVDNNNKNVPFIIFGPPGTGKTSVLVEAILQLWKKSKHFRILVSAGSNAACDEVAVRLCKKLNELQPDGMNLLRIYSASFEKNFENINEDVLEASNLCYSSHFYPSLETIYTYPIVVATLAVAGRLVHGNIANNHFTHVFIDECGASTEPESLLSLSGILSSSGHLIISGDPKQLGPIIECRRAAVYGLERSLLERLMERECYRQHPVTKEYNRSIQARLVRNFRSHKDILALSNQLYYNEELKVQAPTEITDLAIGWSGLRSKNFPLLFESVKGAMRKLKNSTSSCNYEELDCVMLRVKELMFFGIKNRNFEQKDIGIISPYKSQCQLLRNMLDQRGWYHIETGSVETFQGQEKPIIIASMVRSRVNTPGFLDNPKRLNVLLTRAQALLIIVGNPDTLKNIGDWKFVVEYCVENNAIIGAKMSTNEDDGSNESDSTIISQNMQDLTFKDNRNPKSKPCPKKHGNMNQMKKANPSVKNMKAKKAATGKIPHRNNNKMQKGAEKGIDWVQWLDDLPSVADLFENSNSTSESKSFAPKNKTANHAPNVSGFDREDFSKFRSELKGISDLSDTSNKSQKKEKNENEKASSAMNSLQKHKSTTSKGGQNLGYKKINKDQNYKNDPNNANKQQFRKTQSTPNNGPRTHVGVENGPNPLRGPNMYFQGNAYGQPQPRMQSRVYPPFQPHFANFSQNPRAIDVRTMNPNNNGFHGYHPNQAGAYFYTNNTAAGSAFGQNNASQIRAPGPPMNPFEDRNFPIYPKIASASMLPSANQRSVSAIQDRSNQGSYSQQSPGEVLGYPYPEQSKQTPSAPALISNTPAPRQDIIQRQPAYNPSFSEQQMLDNIQKAKGKSKDDANCVIS